MWCTPSRPVPHSRGKAQHYLASRTGPPCHLRPRGVAQQAELDGGIAVKDFPLDYL
jgi:hypothetical protein